jgi:hypothetical protein
VAQDLRLEARPGEAQEGPGRNPLLGEGHLDEPERPAPQADEGPDARVRRSLPARRAEVRDRAVQLALGHPGGPEAPALGRAAPGLRPAARGVAVAHERDEPGHDHGGRDGVRREPRQPDAR